MKTPIAIRDSAPNILMPVPQAFNVPKIAIAIIKEIRESVKYIFVFCCKFIIH